MKLEKLVGKTGYIETEGATVPVYWLSEHSVVLIDSGVEPDEAFLELLDQHALRVRAVLCTHLHFDHIANNHGLFLRYGAEFFAHPLEIDWLSTSGPLPYPITAVEDGSVLKIDDVEFRMLHTPGHTDGHLIWITPDGVCCVGDVIMTQDMLDRAKIPYMEDVDRSIISMEDIRELNYPWYIAAHRGAAPREEIAALVECNIRKELELYDLLRQNITEPMEVETIIDEFVRASGVRSQKMVEQDYVRHTAKVRILALVYAGEFSMEGDWVAPKHY